MIPYLPPAYSPMGAGDLLHAALGAASPAQGHATGALEGLLRDRFQAEEVLLTGSGTEALQWAIRLCIESSGPRPTPIVALPAYSCFDLASAAVGARVQVTLYDLDPQTLTPNLASVERALSEGAAVLVVAPLFGSPIPWAPLEALANAHGALLIEDAAQGGGGMWEGRRLGSFGPLSVLSFGRGKGWTGGGGGALLARGSATARLRDAADRILPARPWGGAFARSILQWGFGRPGLYGIPARIPRLGLGDTVYHSPVPPAAISPFSAGLALRTAPRFEAEGRVRRQWGRWWADQVARVSEGDARLEAIVAPAGGDPGYLRFPILVRGGAGALGGSRSLGILPGYPIPLSELPELRDRLVGRSPQTPGAVRLARELLTLPTHRFVSRRAAEVVIALLAGRPVD